MKTIHRQFLALAVALMALASPVTALSADPKPYPLQTCLVSDEKLGADPDMKPYTFVHEGQEIKLCCKSCLKEFQKAPEKYLKKLETKGKEGVKAPSHDGHGQQPH